MTDERFTGPDTHPGQFWIEGRLIAGADDEAGARAILASASQTVEAPAEPSTDPVAYPLSRFQFEGMLLSMGISFSSVEEAISGLPMTEMEKAFSISRLRNASTYQRDHALIAQLAPIFGLTDEQIDAAWLQAKDVR